MIKIYHSAILTFPSLGIINQMNWEANAAENLGIGWKVQLFCPNDFFDIEVPILKKSKFKLVNKNKFSRGINWIFFKIEYYMNLFKEKKEIDILILRYSVFDPFQLIFILFYNKSIYFIHHTIEIEELKSRKGFLKYFLFFFEKYIAPISMYFSDGIISVTQEILDHQKKRIFKIKKKSNFFIYPNGIEKQFIPNLYEYYIPSDTINILFMANKFFDWQGLDILINSMNKSNEHFILHLIGEIDNDLKYNIINDKKIKYYGVLSNTEIKKIAMKCDIGITSLALHRKKMTQACTLKTREYLSLGLGVFSNHYDVFQDSFLYYRRGNVEISQIISFAKEIKKVNKIEISEKAMEFIEKKILLNEIHKKISSVYSESIKKE